jgi:hypothetical protein
MTGWWEGAGVLFGTICFRRVPLSFSLVAEFKSRLRAARFCASRLDDDGFSYGRGGVGV